MTENIARRRLCWLIDQYLFGNMNTRLFCGKYFDYCMDLDHDIIPEVESQLFSELWRETDHFSSYAKDNFASTRQDIIDKAIQVKVLLGRQWPCVYKDQSVTLQLSTNGRYRYHTATDNQISILAFLLASDLGFDMPVFKRWVYRDEGKALINSLTRLDRDSDFVIIRDLYPDTTTEDSTLEMGVEQFLWLLHDWHEKVHMRQPQEVSIMCINGIYTIETKS